MRREQDAEKRNNRQNVQTRQHIHMLILGVSRVVCRGVACEQYVALPDSVDKPLHRDIHSTHHTQGDSVKTSLFLQAYFLCYPQA